ncbi:integrase catalytic domain-containing protein [Trichonephila clavipes]|nr:integrase catalytic domain-containing protein [Trichonephila clavipes]
MAPKQSKNIGKFDLIIKELKAFGSRINECDDNKSRIRVLKTQVLQYETRLTEIFSELSTHESDESFDIYMKYKDILFHWVVGLEEKSQVEEVNSSIHASVRGDAAKLIRGFAITVDNLKNCWDILCSRQRWELSLENNKIPTLEEFRVFIEREARGLNELKFVKPDIKKSNVKPLNSFNKSNVNTTVVKCNQVKSGVKPDVVKVSPSADTQANSVVTVSNNCTQSAEGHVLLSTALINVKSKHGEQITCRALIDNASQNSLISKQCADRLKLPLKHTNHKLVDVNETFAETSLYSTNFEFSSCVSSDKFQDIPSKDEDELCESIFVNSHIRNADGRYILKLPFRDDSSIGDSKEGALKRFYSLERKLHSNNQLKEQYTEFMEEYQNLSHMTPLASDVKSPHYFLPHHGVINDNSSTTKLRVVFDGSFKSTNGNSLNDILLTGKKLQSDIFLTLLKFRFFPIAFSADIAKMYRQILISQEDACFQQIFWRKSPEEPLVIFKLNTVTYGTSCAPFLAIRTLKQLCEDEKHRFPLAAKLAKDHFYVDDLLAGADSVDSARKIVHELQNLMSAGGFELRKWSCTYPEVLSDLPNTLKTNISSHSFDEESTQNPENSWLILGFKRGFV